MINITLPDGMTDMGDFVFINCSSLENITLPSGITAIGIKAFCDCRSLKSITCLSTVPPYLSLDAFKNTNNLLIYVPAGSVDAYKTADSWKDFANNIKAIPET